jgi:hypothetical protein
MLVRQCIASFFIAAALVLKATPVTAQQTHDSSAASLDSSKAVAVVPPGETVCATAAGHRWARRPRTTQGRRHHLSGAFRPPVVPQGISE